MFIGRIKGKNTIKEVKEIKIKDYGFISINGFENDTSKLKYKFNGDDIYNFILL